jgi:hypothetical protein
VAAGTEAPLCGFNFNKLKKPAASRAATDMVAATIVSG